MHDITQNSMKQKGNSRRRSRGTRIITTVSVALVLTVIGIVALIGRVASGVTDSLRNEMGLVVIVAEEATPIQLDSLKRQLQSAPYAAETKYTSAEQINERMRHELGEEDLADINPFQAEYSIKVKPQWARADSLQNIASRLSSLSAVYEVVVHTEFVTSVNHTVSTVVAILLVVAAVLLAISFVLIFNMVSMEVYAQRMVIHTMQYVGATRRYIMRPYIIRSILIGIIAGVIASLLLSGLIVWAAQYYPTLERYLTWIDAATIFGLLLAGGALISALATWIAAAKYLRRNYDEIFEK